REAQYRAFPRSSRAALGPEGWAMRAAPATTVVAELLREIDPAAHLTDFTELTDRPWYSIRVETPGAAGKSLVLPKMLVSRAQAEPTARQTLTTILRAELTRRPSRDVVQPSHAIAAETRSERDPICPRCSTPIPPGVSVRFEDGETFHIQC